MKISQMLQREDFYSINQKTLSRVFCSDKEKTELYIYPQLNAITTRCSGKAVRQYLYCEYSMASSNIARRIVVMSYVFACLNTFGILAAKKITVFGAVSKNTLIYPCNKKYRIFDFDKNFVSVQIKEGFSDSDLKREIMFRTRENLPGFVPQLVSANEYGYTERIIDGVPLARIKNGFEQFRDNAYGLLLEYSQQYSKTVPGKEYAQQLKHSVTTSCSDKVKDLQSVSLVTEYLADIISSAENIKLTFSHGDLQSGNIWVENSTQKVYIIDWESWGERSSWYDRATLYDFLRPGCISNYLKKDKPIIEKATVLLEDLVFQLTELNNLPFDFGCEQFSDYISKVANWCKTRME